MDDFGDTPILGPFHIFTHFQDDPRVSSIFVDLDKNMCKSICCFNIFFECPARDSVQDFCPSFSELKLFGISFAGGWLLITPCNFHKSVP